MTADPGGFAGDVPSLPDQSVAISYNSTDDLVMTFDAAKGFKFSGKISFRLETGNTHALTISAEAQAFDATGAKIASGKAKRRRAAGRRRGGGFDHAGDGHRHDHRRHHGRRSRDDRARRHGDRDRRAAVPLSTVAICDVSGRHSGGAVVIGVPGRRFTDH